MFAFVAPVAFAKYTWIKTNVGYIFAAHSRGFRTLLHARRYSSFGILFPGRGRAGLSYGALVRPLPPALALPCPGLFAAFVLASLKEPPVSLKTWASGALKPNEPDVRRRNFLLSWCGLPASAPPPPSQTHPLAASAALYGTVLREGCRRNFPRFPCFCPRSLYARELGSTGVRDQTCLRAFAKTLVRTQH